MSTWKTLLFSHFNYSDQGCCRPWPVNQQFDDCTDQPGAKSKYNKKCLSAKFKDVKDDSYYKPHKHRNRKSAKQANKFHISVQFRTLS